MNNNIYDLIIVGGGPCGLACGIAAAKENLNYLIIEKGSLTESIRKYPKNMTFFSTAANIAIGDLPFAASGRKANRIEALQYYRAATEYYGLNVQLYTEVTDIKKTSEVFEVHTSRDEKLIAHNVVMATGYFGLPRPLNIEGENLPHVTHYYEEAFSYVHQKVVMVGGGNSAVEAALDLYHHGVDLTMVIRKEDFKKTAKYWLIPDLRNRIKEGKIKVKFQTEIQKIEKDWVWLLNNETNTLEKYPANFVILLVGYTPDGNFLQKIGMNLNERMVPEFNPDTYETNVPGLYVAGTVLCGIHTEKIFIENGRHHGTNIVQHIKSKALVNK
ncbi:MAG TPA: YpdA family putative bacillithiol disulfide reductase [Microscillaceae bacterium]|nr:YpdA family putative bacillithiol disulfide reductase [Microscillaceae bacterium]